MPCCSCKSVDGRRSCVRCACANAGRPCSDCYPSRSSRCANFDDDGDSGPRPVSQSAFVERLSAPEETTSAPDATRRSYASAVLLSAIASSPTPAGSSRLLRESPDSHLSSGQLSLPSGAAPPLEAPAVGNDEEASLFSSLASSTEASSSSSRPLSISMATASSVSVDVDRDQNVRIRSPSSHENNPDPHGSSQDLFSNYPDYDISQDASIKQNGQPQVTIPELPPFTAMSSPAFRWGLHDGEDVQNILHSIYAEIFHWKRNIFQIPLGAVGKRFAAETTRLLQQFAEGSALESVAFLAMMVMPSLLLQHPDSSATHKERVACLSRCLDLWTDGQFQDLLREGRVIQEHLERTTKRGKQRDQEEDEARFFGRMMFQGKVKGALRALSESGRGRVLMLDEETSPGVPVREAMKSKHPPAGSVHTSALLDEQPPDTHPVAEAHHLSEPY